jgi:Ca-activated chloride channel family protein
MNINTTAPDGAWEELTATIVGRRVIDCDGTLVQRLLVEREDGTEMPVLAGSASDKLAGLVAGEQYVFADVVYCETKTEPTQEACPDCGGALRRGTALDSFEPSLRTAVDRLDLDGMVAVVTDQTRVSEVQPDTEAETDDWIPMEPSASRGVTGPKFVCEDCGQSVDAHQLHATNESLSSGPTEQFQQSSFAADDSLGMATGGAADVTNFRENIRSGYTPQPDALATEGLFYDYHFQTGGTAPETDALFAPQYASALSEHPLTDEVEPYVAVGLDSNISAAEFERPALDLVAVLDISGSMDSQFDQYYYDEHGRRRGTDAGEETKLSAAVDSLCALTEQLEADDRLGVVLYNNRSHVAKPLRDVDATDLPAIRRHLREITAGGGTNLADGFEAAWELLADTPAEGREQRVVFMTDMMPNAGATDEGELTSLFADAASTGVHTTFVGMGLDENADLAAALSGIRGANHYFVTSGEEFRQRLGAEFAYMVTPLVYDLALELDAEGCAIEAVAGSPSADSTTGRLMHVGTLFPSPKQDGEARGGIVLVRLDRAALTADLELVASWTERDGEAYSQRLRIELPDAPESYAHDGVRKAIALSRYARELRSWVETVHTASDRSAAVDDWLLEDGRSEHERDSVPLAVPDDAAARFQRLRAYLADEMAALGDETLQQELNLLTRLCSDTAVELSKRSE